MERINIPALTSGEAIAVQNKHLVAALPLNTKITIKTIVKENYIK
jgi:hypothetical protein